MTLVPRRRRLAALAAAAATFALVWAAAETRVFAHTHPPGTSEAHQASSESATLPPGAPPAVERLGFEEAVEEVQRTSPLMAAAKQGVASLEATLKRAEWAWFPSFRFDAGFAPTPDTDVEVIDGTNETKVDYSQWGVTSRFTLALTQPIYAFGRISALTRAAEHGVVAAQSAVSLARDELRWRVAQAWFGAVMAQELAAILDDGRGWLKKAEERFARLKAEDSDDYDQLQHMRLKTRSAEFHQLEADNRLLATTALEGLRVLLGRASGHKVMPDTDRLEALRFALPPVDDLVAAARRLEPNVRRAQAEASAADALADARFSELLPTLGLTAEASIGYSTSATEDWSITSFDAVYQHGATAQALIALRWNLDIPQRLFRLDEAKAQARAAAELARARGDELEVRVRALAQRLMDQQRLVGIYRRSQKAARGWLQAAWDTYDAGFGSFQEVMDALLQYYGKRVSYLQSVHDLNLQVVELSRLTGRPLVDPPPSP